MTNPTYTNRPLLDHLERASSRDGTVHFPATDQHQPFSAIWRDAHLRAGWFAGHLTAGERIAGVMEPTPDSVACLLGCWLSGHDFVSLPRPARGLDLDGYVIQIRHLMTIAECSRLLIPDDLAHIEGLPGTLRFQDVRGTARSSGADSGRLVQFTSGSTGEVRGISVGMEELGYNLAATSSKLDYRPSDVFFSWLPLSHDMGLVGILLGALAAQSPDLGGASALWLSTPDQFIRDPSSWLRLGADVGGTYTMSPNFALDITTQRAKRLGGLDLSSVRCIVVGSDTVRRDCVDRFLSATEAIGIERKTICPAWGLAEATLIVTAELPDTEITVVPVPGSGELTGPGSESVSIGTPLDGSAIRIDAAEGQIGEIHVDGPSVAGTYIGGEGSHASDGWLRTGDLGFVVDGTLYFAGRIADRLVVSGRNLVATDVELELGSLPGIRQGCCAVVQDGASMSVVLETAASAVKDTERNELRSAVENRAVQRFGARPARVVIVERGTLPKTPSGKMQRSRVIDCLDGVDAAESADAVAVPSP